MINFIFIEFELLPKFLSLESTKKKQKKIR